MEIFIIILHILVCFFLIFIVLLQSGKGAQMGASFGGSSQTLFGARGTTTFLGKLTTGSAIIFMLTSLLLAVFSAKSPSLVPEKPIEETAPAKSMQQTPADQVEGEPKGPHPEGQQGVVPSESTTQPSQESKEGIHPGEGKEDNVKQVAPKQQQTPDTSTTLIPAEKEAEPANLSSDGVEEKQETSPIEPQKNQ